MSLSLVINSSNVVNNGSNAQFVYNFINGSLSIPEGSEICASNITIPYAFFNINGQLYNNNVFQYTFPTSSGQQTFVVTLPNGFYTVDNINQYLQTVFIQNGHYLVNSSSQNVYYMTLQYNTTYYAVQVVCYAVPNSLPSGFTNPANMPFPSSATTPQLVIGTNNFGNIIGFTTGSYPSTPQSSNQSFLSNAVANGSPINSLILRCNLVNNNVSMPSDVLTSIPITTTFGSNINYVPTFPQWMKMKPGRYAHMTLTLNDQNANPIISKDPNVAIVILIKYPDSNLSNSSK